jgi:hypothetical protein
LPRTSRLPTAEGNESKFGFGRGQRCERPHVTIGIVKLGELRTWPSAGIAWTLIASK